MPVSELITVGRGMGALIGQVRPRVLHGVLGSHPDWGEQGVTTVKGKWVLLAEGGEMSAKQMSAERDLVLSSGI